MGAEVTGHPTLLAPQRTSKTITFAGTGGTGAVGTPVDIFTITGEVLVLAIYGFCTTSLTEAMATATVALGVTGSIALFIAATNSVNIDASEFWVDTAPDANGVALPALCKDILITDNVIITPATQDTATGVLRIDCLWIPSASGATLVEA